MVGEFYLEKKSRGHGEGRMVGSQSPPYPDGGRLASRRPLQGCGTPRWRAPHSAQLLRAMTRYGPSLSSSSHSAGLERIRDPGTTSPPGAVSPPTTRGVAGTLCLGPE